MQEKFQARLLELKADYYGWPFVLSLVIFILDQVTKVLTVQARPIAPDHISTIIPGIFNLVLITQGVLHVEPWYQPTVVIPLAGMIFANAMNSVSLAGERLYSEIGHRLDYRRARNAAFQAAMIPVVNSLLAVGLVSLPGMMTGQILAGTSPLIAARYQIIVMCMIFGSAGISTALFLWLIRGQSLQQTAEGGAESCG